ncbi:MAG: tRNA lysidine(34) synthetase TilS [Acidimicrobiia bacterium]|jgi:tRNA(Ile)-lysidine synthase
MARSSRLTELVGSARSRLRFPDGPFTVALSGGADSATLAFLAVESGPGADAIHIDHGLPASPMLRMAAAEIAGRLGIDLEIVFVELGEGPSLEDRARTARYEVLDSWGQNVLTAHTREDNAETILINLIRGTGPSGLAGIPFHRPPRTYRPMLDVTRDETREIASLAGLPFRDDPMNSDLELIRNRLRHQIIPQLREMNPRVVDALARAATAVGADTALLDGMVAEIDTTAGVPVAVLTTLPRPLSDRVLGRLLAANGVGVTDDRLIRARSVVEGEAPRQDLADGRIIERRDAMVVVVAAIGTD